MGQATLVARLAARDLRRRPAEAVLLLLAIVAAMATLTVGLTVRDLVAEPYQSTREATLGPDVVAFAGPPPGETPGLQSDRPTDFALLDDLINAEGVVGHSGPFPVANVEMSANGQIMDAQAVGRDGEPASIDQPLVTRGGWVEEGGVVVEAAFASANDLNVGDQVSLNSQPFEVVGLAVTAASAPYPETVCLSACVFGASPEELAELQPPAWLLVEPGLVWVTRTDAEGLVPAPVSMPHVINLRLQDPDTAGDFVDAHVASEPSRYGLIAWQEIFERSARRVRDTQRVFLVGSGLLILMAMATVAVLVGGRMADQSRRVGLLKAVGATPQLVAAVLLTEYVVLALLGAAAGLVLGWLIAPLLIEPSVGLIGAAAPGLTVPTIAVVTGVALLVAATATMVPALRAARSSTVVALADMARPARRTRWLIAISSRLPTSLLLSLRMLARRPRRGILSSLGIAVTVTGLVAAVAARASLHEQIVAGGSRAANVERLWPVLMMLMATMVALAAVNAVFITWATVFDARQPSAVARSLGATPAQVSAGLAMTQLLPASVGAILGLPAGIALYIALDDGVATLPPLWQLVAVVPVVLVVIALLTAIPARAGGRRPVVEILQSEHA